MIRFSCPGCGAVYSVTDEKAGKTGKCPKCQTPFTIPAAEAPAPAAPPPPPPKPAPSSNPFADLADDGAPKKKKPSKADLDDDFDDRPKKKKPSRADDDDYDDAPKKKPARAADEDDDYDRPKKKPRRDEEDDDYDDAPKKKKAPSKAELDDDYDDRPKKKPRRDDDEDYDDVPRKKPARASGGDFDDLDDEDDRPRKKKGRRDDNDFDDDYDDRPRKKKKSNGLLMTASILHIIAAVLYIPCGGIGLAAASSLGFLAGAADTSVRVGGQQVRTSGNATQRADLAEAERLVSEAKTAITILQIIFILALLGGILAIPAAVGGFMKKKWFTFLSLGAGGLLILYSLLYLVLTAMYVPFNFLGVLLMMLIPLSFGVVAILAAVNKNVKRVLS